MLILLFACLGGLVISRLRFEWKPKISGWEWGRSLLYIYWYHFGFVLFSIRGGRVIDVW